MYIILSGKCKISTELIRIEMMHVQVFIFQSQFLIQYFCLSIECEQSFWNCNFPLTTHVRLVVGLSVCQNFLKRAGSCYTSFRSTCFLLAHGNFEGSSFYFVPEKCQLCPGELDLHLQKGLCLQNSYNNLVDINFW